MTLEDQMLFEEYQKDRKRFNEEYSEQKKSTAQGNHSDRAVRYETETAYEGASR